MQIRTKTQGPGTWTPKQPRLSPSSPAPQPPARRGRWEVALCPDFGPYSTLYREAGPCDELNKARAQQLSLLGPTMEHTRARARLQVLLGHLGRPSAPSIVSFGLWMGSQAGRSISTLVVTPRAQETLCASVSSPSPLPGVPGWRLHPQRTLVLWKGDGCDSLGLGGWRASPQHFEPAYHRGFLLGVKREV